MKASPSPGNWRALDGGVISDELNAYGNFVVVECLRERTSEDDANIVLLAASKELLRGCQAAMAYLAHPPTRYANNRLEAERIIMEALKKAGAA